MQTTLAVPPKPGTDLLTTGQRRLIGNYRHTHPRLTAAIAEQAGRLIHVSNYFYNAENIRLADEKVDAALAEVAA
jgi:hypothetical protein